VEQHSTMRARARVTPPALGNPHKQPWHASTDAFNSILTAFNIKTVQTAFERLRHLSPATPMAAKRR